MSALVTPFLLCFSVRYKALDIVDFFRNFTVEVVGVGDVCSFAQMDVRKHGNPEVSLHLKSSFNSPISPNLLVLLRVMFATLISEGSRKLS